VTPAEQTCEREFLLAHLYLLNTSYLHYRYPFWFAALAAARCDRANDLLFGHPAAYPNLLALPEHVPEDSWLSQLNEVLTKWRPRDVPRDEPLLMLYPIALSPATLWRPRRPEAPLLVLTPHRLWLQGSKDTIIFEENEGLLGLNADWRGPGLRLLILTTMRVIDVAAWSKYLWCATESLEKDEGRHASVLPDAGAVLTHRRLLARGTGMDATEAILRGEGLPPIRSFPLSELQGVQFRKGGIFGTSHTTEVVTRASEDNVFRLNTWNDEEGQERIAGAFQERGVPVLEQPVPQQFRCENCRGVLANEADTCTACGYTKPVGGLLTTLVIALGGLLMGLLGLGPFFLPSDFFSSDDPAWAIWVIRLIGVLCLCVSCYDLRIRWKNRCALSMRAKG